MYEHISEDLVDDSHAVQLSQPEWMDVEGNIVYKCLAFGYKVTHKIKYPEIMILKTKLVSTLT